MNIVWSIVSNGGVVENSLHGTITPASALVLLVQG